MFSLPLFLLRFLTPTNFDFKVSSISCSPLILYLEKFCCWRRGVVSDGCEGGSGGGHTFALIAVRLLAWQQTILRIEMKTGKRFVISASRYGHWPVTGMVWHLVCKPVTFFTLHSVWYTF